MTFISQQHTAKTVLCKQFADTFPCFYCTEHVNVPIRSGKNCMWNFGFHDLTWTLIFQYMINTEFFFLSFYVPWFFWTVFFFTMNYKRKAKKVNACLQNTNKFQHTHGPTVDKTQQWFVSTCNWLKNTASLLSLTLEKLHSVAENNPKEGENRREEEGIKEAGLSWEEVVWGDKKNWHILEILSVVLE